MLTYEQNKELKAAIQKAVPDIMELKFGCEVIPPAWEDIGFRVVAEIGICARHKTYKGCENGDGDCQPDDGVKCVASTDDGVFIINVKISDLKPYQILGRTIRLSDVLAACFSREATIGDVTVTEQGNLIDKRLAQILYFWDKFKDDLSEQSDETQKYLFDILC